jgi:DNA ligase (NAD+)
MNIEGLSEASIEKFMERGMLHELADLFRLADYRDEIVQMEGFGEKSCEKLLGAIEAARETTLPAFLYSLGIPNIGISNAKMICNAFGHDLEKIRCASAEDLTHIDGVGEVIAKSFVEYFAVPEHRRIVDDLLAQIHIRPLEETEEKALQMQGEIVVITGSLEIFANRKALKERIEQLGGKVTGSVTSKTTCLINNDRNSTSSKNKKAKELNVTILTEKEAVERWGMI